MEATPEQWPTLCAELKNSAAALRMSTLQRDALEKCRTALSANGGGTLFAVRSSSPEEDLTSASFAGGYETCLGVRLADLEAARQLATTAVPRAADEMHFWEWLGGRFSVGPFSGG